MKWFITALLITSYAFAAEEVCYVEKTVSQISSSGHEGNTISSLELHDLPMPAPGEAKYYVSPNSSEVVVLINYGIDSGERSFEVYFHKNINSLKDANGKIDPHLGAVRPATSVQGYFTPGQNTVWVSAKVFNESTVTRITAFCGK